MTRPSSTISPPPSSTARRRLGRRRSQRALTDRPLVGRLRRSPASRRRTARPLHTIVRRPRQTWGHFAADRADRPRLVRRGLSRLGPAARPRGRAQAAAGRCGRRRARGDLDHRRRPPAGARAPSQRRHHLRRRAASTTASACGWSSSTAARSSNVVAARDDALRREVDRRSASTSAARSRRCMAPACSTATSRRAT